MLTGAGSGTRRGPERQLPVHARHLRSDHRRAALLRRRPGRRDHARASSTSSIATPAARGVSILKEYNFGPTESVSTIGFDSTSAATWSRPRRSANDGRLYYFDLGHRSDPDATNDQHEPGADSIALSPLASWPGGAGRRCRRRGVAGGAAHAPTTGRPLGSTPRTAGCRAERSGAALRRRALVARSAGRTRGALASPVVADGFVVSADARRHGERAGGGHGGARLAGGAGGGGPGDAGASPAGGSSCPRSAGRSWRWASPTGGRSGRPIWAG